MNVSFKRVSIVLILFVFVLTLGVSQQPVVNTKPVYYSERVLPLSLESFGLQYGAE